MRAQNNTDGSVPAKYSTGFLENLDGRLGVARDLRQRFEALTADLGGSDSLSYAQRSLCERALFLEFWLARQEATLANGGKFEVSAWVQATNSLQGIFAKLGLKRVARDVPDLQTWIKRREQSNGSPVR
jgi:hypothetical protein